MEALDIHPLDAISDVDQAEGFVLHSIFEAGMGWGWRTPDSRRTTLTSQPGRRWRFARTRNDLLQLLCQAAIMFTWRCLVVVCLNLQRIANGAPPTSSGLHVDPGKAVGLDHRALE